MTLFYLDRYHLGDPLFLSRLAPAITTHPRPLVIVHGAGEAAERAIEAEGIIPGASEADSARTAALTDRAARDLNRTITHTLNDAGVPAVGIRAGDRGLFRISEGQIAARRPSWLWETAERGAVPVLALIAANEQGRALELDPAIALAGLATRHDGAVVRCITRRGAMGGNALESPIRVGSEGVSEAAPAHKLIGRLVAEGIAVEIVEDGRLGLPASAVHSRRTGT